MQRKFKQFLWKIHFQNCDLSSEKIQLCKFSKWKQKLLHHTSQWCRKLSSPFRFRLKRGAILQTGRPNKVPLRYTEDLNAFLDDLQKNWANKKIGSTPHGNTINRTTFVNPFVIIKKLTLSKLLWTLDIWTQTLSNQLNPGHWNHKSRGLLELINVQICNWSYVCWCTSYIRRWSN